MSNRLVSRVGIVVLIMALLGCAGREVRDEAARSDESSSSAPSAPYQAASNQKDSQSGELIEGKKNAEIAQKNTEVSAEYHFSMAQAYVAEGNPDRAIEEYKLTLMFDPNSPLVYARLAAEYVKKGMLSAAMETCKEALQRDPKFIDARLMLAGLYSTSHETEAALVEYDRVLKFDPKNEEAAIYKAQALIDAEREAEAVKTLRTFVKKSSDSALVWYYLGRAEHKMDHFKESALAYKRAMDLRPGFTQASLALGYLYEEKQMNAQAIRVYKESYDYNQDTLAANRIATIYLKEEKYTEAVPYLQAIEAQDPEDMNVRVKLGLVHMELKNYDKAVSIFQNILAKNPESDRIHYYLGSLYEETKRFDEAISELKQVSPQSKLYSDSALHVAYLLKTANRTEEAKRYLDEAIEKSPRISGFYLFQASLEEETNNLTGALKILEAAVTKFPEDEKLRYYLGSVYDRRGETDKSLDQMEQLLSINPNNVDALNYIGYTWTERGMRLNDAEKMLRRALGLKPDNGYIQDSWGWHLFIRGRVSEAVVELEKAAKLKPNEATILEHLGDAYLRSNLREKAAEQYKQAVKHSESAQVKKKIELKLQTLKRELAGSEKPVSPPIEGDETIRAPASSD